MTKTEAIEYLEKDIKLHELFNETKHQEKAIEALNMAIKALEQKPSCRNTRQVDLISRQAAIDALYDKGLSMTAWGEVLTMKWSDIQKCIEQLPSAEPKRGKWIDRVTDIDARFGRHDFVCSECARFADYFIGGSEDWWGTEKPNYCPHCGARMESDEE